MKRLIPLTLACLLAFAGTASAKFYVPRHGHACRAHYVKRTVHVRDHGKLVKQVRCVYVAPKPVVTPTTAPTPLPTTPAAPVTTVPMPVRAGIDPAYVQDPTDNLKVTWTYSAAAAILPAGTLALTVNEPGAAGVSGGCIINVGGGPTKGGTCTLELPHYGIWQVSVTFTGQSVNVTPSTSTDTENIEPLPATVAYQWGTDQGTANPAIAATVIGQTANTTVTDPSFEGASSVTITDNLGDGCQATVSGTQATCAMPVTGTPSSYTIGYPGGASTTGTRTVVPNGVQQVTYTWPSANVQVAKPSVTVQQATIEECGYGIQHQVGDNEGTCTYGNPVNWPNPIATGTATRVNLYAVAYGSLPTDRDPTHGGGYVSGYLTFTITGGVAGTDYTATDIQYGPDNGPGCTKVLTQQWLGGDPNNNGPDEPAGACQLVFNTPGAYTVIVSYTSEDANYAGSQLASSETISVT